ncbi:MAG: hypothetical protein HQ567_29655 [Candidatus Nealsonbacteria bacterium]|nr:hypothetical protein [Candidatus Nealsonbacteria bacterium]
MKRIGWIATLLCLAWVMTGCSNSDDQSGKPAVDGSTPAAGDDSPSTAGGAVESSSETKAVAKQMAGKGGQKVNDAVGNALWKSVAGDTDDEPKE